MLSTQGLIVSTPELLWHGGGSENGKPDPVFSCDLNASNILATAGIDAGLPPKGCIRLWRFDENSKMHTDFIIEFADHQKTCNVVRFSPCGKMVASASTKQIVIYVVKDSSEWTKLEDIKQVERIWMRPNHINDEIYDLQWSPDSTHIIVGSIDTKAEILRVGSRDGAVLLSGHTSYVQGVAWDPLNQMVVTQSADRSCKIHMVLLYIFQIGIHYYHNDFYYHEIILFERLALHICLHFASICVC